MRDPLLVLVGLAAGLAGQTITVTPSAETVSTGTSRQFTANATVTWSVNGVGGGAAIGCERVEPAIEQRGAGVAVRQWDAVGAVGEWGDQSRGEPCGVVEFGAGCGADGGAVADGGSDHFRAEPVGRFAAGVLLLAGRIRYALGAGWCA